MGLVMSAFHKATNAVGLTSDPQTVNQRGDVLDTKAFQGLRDIKDPAQRSEALFNWLTSGGLPKDVDPAKIFADKQDQAPMEEKAARGQGFAGLFGTGPLVGEFKPPDLQAGVPFNGAAVPKLVGK